MLSRKEFRVPYKLPALALTQSHSAPFFRRINEDTPAFYVSLASMIKKVGTEVVLSPWKMLIGV
jgi:hypothetical protein